VASGCHQPSPAGLVRQQDDRARRTHDGSGRRLTPLTVAHAGKTLAKQPNRERARHTPLVVILLKRTLLRALMNRLQIVNELIIERYRGLNRKVIRLFEADRLQ
jgi:hypothetical protein